MRFVSIVMFCVLLYSCKGKSSPDKTVTNSNYVESSDSQFKAEDGYANGDGVRNTNATPAQSAES